MRGKLESPPNAAPRTGRHPIFHSVPGRCGSERERAPHLGGTEGVPVLRSVRPAASAPAVSTGPAPDRAAVALPLPDNALDALAAALAERLGATSPPPLLDLPAVARWLNVSERLVETFVAAGDIPVLRIGQGRGVRRFEAAAIEAFIRRQANTVGLGRSR